MKREKVKLKEILICIFTTFFSWIFFIVFLYSSNVREVNISETGGSFAIFITCAIVTVGVGWILYRNIYIASVFSVILAILLTNFSLILAAMQKGIPQVRYWHLLYIDVVFALLLSGLAKQYMNKYMMEIIKVVCIVYTGLIVINLITATPTIIRKIVADKNMELPQNAIESQGGQYKGTNIYYLLCDEYASFDQLVQEFEYENLEFRNYLIQNDFNISENSSNYSRATHVVLSNIMSLDYVADSDSTVIELENYCKGGALHSILNEYGYISRGIGGTAWLGIEGTVEAQGGARTAEGESFETVILNNTFLFFGIQNNYSEAAQGIVDSLNDFVNMPINPNSSEFVMIYIRAPHHPYYFKKDGSMNMPSDYVNYDGTNPESYLGEIEWLNGYLEKGIDHIIKKDPQCIIVLCSDHGNRFGVKNKDLVEKILNAIYYKGEVCEEIKDLSGINTMKYILNHEFGTGLEYTADPQ